MYRRWSLINRISRETVLIGAPQTVCLSSHNWTEPNPECVPVCSNRTLENGMEMYNVSGHLFPGTAAESVCDDGFELVGPAMALCTVNATWDQEFPMCKREFFL